MNLFKRKTKNQVAIRGEFQQAKLPDISGPQNVSGKWPLRKKLAILGVAVVVLLAGGSGYWYYAQHGKAVAGDTSQNLAQTDPQGDPDGDGLSNEKEAYYGTDANDPDSDNDGYSDGEEVASGHNPIGSGKLNKKGGSVVGDYSGVSLETVFAGEGSYLCNMSMSQQDTPVKIVLKVSGKNIRQEMIPNFPNENNSRLDPIVLVKNDQAVFFGSGSNDKGWLKLTYDNTAKAWTAAGVSLSGGLFISPEEVRKAEPDKVECNAAELQPSEFAIAEKYIIEPGMTYQQFQDKVKNTK
jgi:hypothetical protein